MSSQQIQWHKLDRDRTVAMIDSVKTAGDYILFTLATSEAKCARLPFYRNFLVYRLTNYASLPSFSFDYIGDGKTFFHLNGGAEPIYDANSSGGLVLNEQTVIPYVSFFFNHVSGPDGDIFVIDDVQDHPVLHTLDESQAAALTAQFQPSEVIANPDGSFVIITTLLYLGAMVRATIEVSGIGEIDIKDFHMLMAITADLDSMKEATY